MQRLSISEFSSFRWTFFQDVIRYSQLGVHSIGVWRSKTEEFGYEEAADLLFEMQMRVSSLSWAGGFTGSNGFSHVAAVDDAIEAVYQAHLIGAKQLIVYPGGRNHHTQSHAFRLAKNGIEAMLPTARDLGVKIVIEPILDRPSPWSFMNGPEAYLDLIRHFCPNEVGIVLDLFHVGQNVGFLAEIASLADRIALVQLADGRFEHREFVRCQLGQGRIPIGRWLTMLQQIDYEGDFEIELHGYEFEDLDYRDVLEQSRDYCENAIDVLRTKTTS